MSLEQLTDWAEQGAEAQVRSLARVGRNEQKPAGADWSPLGVIKHINPPRMIGARVGYTF